MNLQNELHVGDEVAGFQITQVEPVPDLRAAASVRTRRWGAIQAGTRIGFRS